MIYISSPYTHKDQHVIDLRIHQTENFIIWVMEKGYYPISIPIQFHKLVKEKRLPIDNLYWENYYKNIIPKASEVFVLMLDGWDISVGIQNEIKQATDLEIRILFFKPYNGDYIWYPSLSL